MMLDNHVNTVIPIVATGGVVSPDRHHVRAEADSTDSGGISANVFGMDWIFVWRECRWHGMTTNRPKQPRHE